jgi:hypothetical protein
VILKDLDNGNANPEMLSNKCPRCGRIGSGPYRRWVRNSRGKRYEPYEYFAHRVKGKLKWCYLGKVKKELDNKDVTQLSNTPLMEATL